MRMSESGAGLKGSRGRRKSMKGKGKKEEGEQEKLFTKRREEGWEEGREGTGEGRGRSDGKGGRKAIERKPWGRGRKSFYTFL